MFKISFLNHGDAHAQCLWKGKIALEKHDREIKEEIQRQRTLKSIALEESVATNNEPEAI